ncbi:MAG: DapH/DapD/GlmU-related protein, partial [Acinetobacter sp.]
NDKMPRSKLYPEQFSRIHLKQNCSIGANATLLPGITVGRHAMVGAGAVVSKDVPDYAVVVGNPAKVIRYIEN